MAQSKKPGGNAAKSKGGVPPVLLVAVAGGLAYLFINSSSDSTTTGSGTTTGSNYTGGAVAPMTPNQSSVQTSTPTSVPTSVPTTPGSGSSSLIDRWGVPHFTAATIDWANGFDDVKGHLFRTLSDGYGLYATEIDTLIVYDQSQSGNSITGIVNWYTANPDKFAGLIPAYNAANPATPIIRRIGGDTTGGSTTTGGGSTTAPTGPFLDRWGIPHFTSATVDWANGFDDAKGTLYKAISDLFHLYATEIDAVMVYEQARSGNSYNDIFRYFGSNVSAFGGYITGYNQANPATPIVLRA